MKYQFKQAVHIRPKGRPGKAFSLGIHEVDESFEYDAYFLKLVQAGLIVEAPLTKIAEPISAQQLAKSLLDKLALRKRAKTAASAPKEPSDGVQDVDPVGALVDAVSAPSDAPKPEKKKSKG